MPPTFLGTVVECVVSILADMVAVVLGGTSRSKRSTPTWALWLGLFLFLAALFAIYLWLG